MDLLEPLRALPLLFNPGLHGPALLDFARELGLAELPREVRELYEECDGWRASSLPVRLMASEEVIALHRALPSPHGQYAPPSQVRYFWTNDGSDYAGIFVVGPFEGRVCWLDHEEPDPTPRYRSTASFLASWREAHRLGREWQEMTADHPATGPLDDAARESDRAAVRAVNESLREPRGRAHRKELAFAAMALTPQEDALELLPFLADDDMWIQERAAEELGKRRCVEAIVHLQRVATSGTHNGRLAAELALGRIGTTDCVDFLLTHARAQPDRAPYVVAALRLAGWEVRPAEGRVRRPGAWRWISLR